MKLPAAYSALGNDVYRDGRYREEFPHLYKQVNDTMATLAALKEGTPSSDALPVQTLADKTVKTAGKIKARAKSELLAVEAKQFLRQIGEAAFQKNSTSSGPEALTMPIKDLLSRLAVLDEQISRLSESRKGQLLTPRRIIVGVIALVLALGAYWGYSRIQQSGTAGAIKRQVALDQARFEKEMALDQARYEKAEAERKALEAQLEREAKQWEAKQRLKKAQEAAAAQQEQKQKEEMAKRERAETAARIFASVNINPRITFCQTLAAGKPRIELCGEKAAAIQSAVKSEDWLDLINIVTGSAFEEFPDARTIARAYEDLMRHHFYVLITTTVDYEGSMSSGPRQSGPKIGRLAKEPADWYRYAHLGLDTGWTEHPDGVGWLFEWSPSQGEILIVLATDDLDIRLWGLNSRRDQKSDWLKQKQRLGEITATAALKSLEDMYSREWDKLRAYALAQ